MTFQTIAIIGATGQVGYPLTESLLQLGHKVKLFSRKTVEQDKSGKLKNLQDLGGEVVSISDMMDFDSMKDALKGTETLVCAVPATEKIINESEPLWLKAAVAAKLKRFVPNEFGGHTRGIDWGDGLIFDYKKRLHQQIFDSDIGWTLFYNGGIFDYFLPNLRFFEKITTFGDLDLPIYTHQIKDIGRCAARALTDPRTINKCVQMDFNVLSQNEAVTMLKNSFPDYPFEYQYYSKEDIISNKESASNEISAKKGAETDKERWGINYVIYVKGKLASFTEDTVRATELYPDFQVSAKPEIALADPSFVFDLPK